jgi:hypothetical protein
LWPGLFIPAAIAATLSSGAKDVHLDQARKILGRIAPDHLREKLHRAKTSRRRDAVAIALTPSRDIAT